MRSPGHLNDPAAVGWKDGTADAAPRRVGVVAAIGDSQGDRKQAADAAAAADSVVAGIAHDGRSVDEEVR